MINNVPKPTISPDFTIEDIHKIREWHYEILKDATPQERADYYNAGSREFQNYLAEYKRSKTLEHITKIY